MSTAATFPAWLRDQRLERFVIAKLSVGQYEAIEWAASAMIDFWADSEREREGCDVIEYPVVMVRTTSRREAHIACHRGVLEDLKYRLVDFYPDVVEEMDNAHHLVRSAENAWTKIETAAAALGFHGITAK